jgi:hypothetical protein
VAEALAENMMSRRGLSSPPYLRQRLTGEHLDALEAIALREHGGLFATRGRPSNTIRSQREAHLRCLRFRRDDAVRECLVRLQTRSFSSVANAAHVLATLDPDHARDPSGGILLEARRSHASDA